MSRTNVKTKCTVPGRLTIYDILINAESRISSISDTPKLDSHLLMSQILTRPREWLIAHRDDELDSKSIANFETLLQRRMSGEPIAYITGERAFWQRDFIVSPDVLIPRPETELLVENLLSRLGPGENHVVDLGTGSGAIAISVAAERPAWIVTGIDRSPDAINIAKRNAKDLDNVEMKIGNWCDDLMARGIDAIVSNPPYLREDDPHLPKLRHEPIDALVSGSDGLAAIQEIIPSAYRCLNTGGLLLIEHGYNQQESVIEMYKRSLFKRVSGMNDLNNLPRAVVGYRL